MSDADNEKNVFAEEDAEESFSRLPLVKTRTRKSLSELRHPRQKFCARWEKDFPWLKADKVDESVGICNVCNKHLVCKKSHLERHQRSYKHQRLQGFETFDTEGEISHPNTTEFLECGKKELDEEEFDQAIELDPDYNVEFEHSDKKNKRGSGSKSKSSVRRSAVLASKNSHSTVIDSAKLDRFKLLKRIERDRNVLNEYYYGRRKPLSPTIQNSKDPFDLFFESVSASVKTLPPKLAAEVKGRVSQLVAEFELRAICEREVQENSATNVGSSTPETATVVIATTNAHSNDMTPSVTQESAVVDPATGVPHIVYTFRPKSRE